MFENIFYKVKDFKKCQVSNARKQGWMVYSKLSDQIYRMKKYNWLSKNDLIVLCIRTKYTIDDEIAINRQKEQKLDEWQAYFDFCEQCKSEVNRFLIERESVK